MIKRLAVVMLVVIGLLTALVVPVAAQGNRADRLGNQPFLGIQYDDVNGEVVVTQVLPGSPADAAGLMVNDVIVAVNGVEVTASSIADTIAGLSVDETVVLSIRRGEEMLDLEATLAGRGVRMFERDAFADGAFLGVNLESVDSGQLVVKEIVADGPAANAGIQVDDVLVEIDGETVSEIADVMAVLNANSPGDTITVTVERDGETQELEVELGSRMAPGMNLGMNLGNDEVEYNEENRTWTLVKVDENGILAEAGLQDGDVISAVDGEPLSLDNMPAMRGFMNPNGTITLTVERNGETMDIEAPAMVAIVLLSSEAGVMQFHEVMPGGNHPFGFQFRGPDGNMPFGFGDRGDNGRFGQRGFGFGIPGMNRAFLGVAFATLDEDVAAANNVDVTEGALIQEVLEDSPAAKAGLLAGDVIVAVDGDLVDEERTLADRIFAYEPGDTITLEVIRDGDTMQIDVTLSEPMGMMMPNPPQMQQQGKPDA